MIAWAMGDTTVRPTPEPPSCTDCGTAIHDGDICIECWRDRRDLATERNREWWAA